MNDRLLLTVSILTFLSPGLYGTLGALGYYTFQILQKKDAWSPWRALLYMFLGFVVGMIVHDLSLFMIHTSYPGLLIASGFAVQKMGAIADRFLSVTNITK